MSTRINYMLNSYLNRKEYRFVKFTVNSESINLTSHTEEELRTEYSNSPQALILPLPYDQKHLPHSGKILCQKISSIAIWANHSIMLQDTENNQLVFSGSGTTIPLAFINANKNWANLLHKLEKNLFPFLVNNMVKQILDKKVIEISKTYNLKVSMDGISVGGERGIIINLENIICKIDLKKWEVKLSNKKNIFQYKKLSTNESNIIIMPYLIDYLKAIKNQ